MALDRDRRRIKKQTVRVKLSERQGKRIESDIQGIERDTKNDYKKNATKRQGKERYREQDYRA